MRVPSEGEIRECLEYYATAKANGMACEPQAHVWALCKLLADHVADRVVTMKELNQLIRDMNMAPGRRGDAT